MMVLPKVATIISDLQNCFNSIQQHLQLLPTLSFNILDWFQDLCNQLTKVINLICCFYRETGEECKKSTSHTILLYLTQIITLLSLLTNIFVSEEETKSILLEARKCILKQMTCCLESIRVTLDTNQCIENPSGNFVKWMDLALEKITEINVSDKNKIEVFENTCQFFEEVMSQAMSIAQVSLSEDSKIIRGSCHSVLSALGSLKRELSNIEPNPSMVTLFKDACSDKLCMLEKKVNTAVLKLCLDTFTRFTAPLDEIKTFCFNHNNKNNNDQFDSLVADFDLHVDRIMQIGLFAVSCSSDHARGIKIRSCLASLEALESELVPSLSTALLDNSAVNINSANILMNHWLDQAFTLQQFIFLIIDPFAFCQVVYEEASEIVDKLSNLLRKNTLIKLSDITHYILIMKLLRTFLEKAQTEFTDSEKSKIHARYKDFTEVLEEVEKASFLLLKDEHINLDNCKRVLKRCKILLTITKRVWFCFADEILLKKEATSEKENIILEIDNMQIEPTGNNFLDHIINRGKQILQERSVLYRTPVKNATFKKNDVILTKNQKNDIPLSKLVHLRKLNFTSLNKTGTSVDLQITDILNEVNNMSLSFKPDLRKLSIN